MRPRLHLTTNSYGMGACVWSHNKYGGSEGDPDITEMGA